MLSLPHPAGVMGAGSGKFLHGSEHPHGPCLLNNNKEMMLDDDVTLASLVRCSVPLGWCLVHTEVDKPAPALAGICGSFRSSSRDSCVKIYQFQV